MLGNRFYLETFKSSNLSGDHSFLVPTLPHPYSKYKGSNNINYLLQLEKGLVYHHLLNVPNSIAPGS